MATKSNYGREMTDADIRARQQSDLDKSAKMMAEDLDTSKPKKYTADQIKDRLSFMNESLRNARAQKELDAEIIDKPKREAADELRRETRGVKATPEADARSVALRRFYQGFDKPLFGGKEGLPLPGMKKGGAVKKMAKGGSVPSASKRADGIAQRGKTKGRMV